MQRMSAVSGQHRRALARPPVQVGKRTPSWIRWAMTAGLTLLRSAAALSNTSVSRLPTATTVENDSRAHRNEEKETLSAVPPYQRAVGDQ